MNPFDDLIHSELEHFENSLDAALAADVELVHEITICQQETFEACISFLSAKAVGQEVEMISSSSSSSRNDSQQLWSMMM